MKLQHFKVVFMAVGLIGLLLFLTPPVGFTLHQSAGEEYSDFYLLGSKHQMGDYPFNVSPKEIYSVYLGISNHRASTTYYVAYIKFGDKAMLPNSSFTSAGNPSVLAPLFEYHQVIQPDGTSELSINFSISKASLISNQSMIETLDINGNTFVVNTHAMLNSEHQDLHNQTISGFYYELIFELWTYNVKSNLLIYDGNYVNLPLNLTSAF